MQSSGGLFAPSYHLEMRLLKNVSGTNSIVHNDRFPSGDQYVMKTQKQPVSRLTKGSRERRKSRSDLKDVARVPRPKCVRPSQLPDQHADDQARVGAGADQVLVGAGADQELDADRPLALMDRGNEFVLGVVDGRTDGEGVPSAYRNSWSMRRTWPD